MRKRRLCLEDLEPRDVPSAVSYHGGDLLTYVHVGALYYGNAWHDQSNQQAIGYINSFLSYIVQSPYMDMLSEYYQSGVPSFDPPNVGRGVFVGGWIQNVNTGSVVTDDGGSNSPGAGGVQQSLRSDIDNGGLPSLDNFQNFWVVVLPPGAASDVCRSQNFLAYHSSFLNPDNYPDSPTTHLINYAVIQYPGQGNPTITGLSRPLDEITAVTSHELAEGVTDPNTIWGPSGPAQGSGWHGDYRESEIGDLAEGNFGKLNGYVVQAEYSNRYGRPILPSGATGLTVGGGGGGNGGDGVDGPGEVVGPTANGDLFDVPAGQPAALNVLFNDTDPYFNALSPTIESPPAHGLVAINPDGSIEYAPEPGYTGPDLFSYSVSDGTFTSPPAYVSLFVAPAVTGVSPNSGPVSGGSVVTITGAGLSGATAVTFGGAPAGFTVNADGSITAVAPPGGTGPVDVTVSTPGGPTAPTPADLFTYAAAPTVTAVSPTSGPVAGGSAVTITGTGLAGATGVAFGAAPAGFIFDADGSITAFAPPAAAGPVDVTVTTPGGTSGLTPADVFTYAAAPAVTGVSPPAGPLSGGTAVTITGAGLSGATAVAFGGAAVTFFVTSDTSITAIAPGGVGPVDVTVTTPGGTSGLTPADLFTYAAAPTVTGVDPAGPLSGGTVVTITGAGLSGATAVAFGGAPAGFTVNSDTSITAVAPPGAAGPVDVTVTTPGGTSAASPADVFTYTVPQPPPPPPPTPPPPPLLPPPGPPPVVSSLSVSGAAGGAAQQYQAGTLQPVGGPVAPFPGFAGGVRAATGDFDGDGVMDTVLVTGPGVKTRMAVVSGKDGSTLVPPTDPFGDANFTSGGFVTAGDIDGDGRAEWVVTPELRGGPRVVIFRLLADGSFDITSPGQPSLVANFFGIGDPAFRDGDRAALGDVNGDGVLDVFSIAAFNGGPRTALYDGRDVLGARAANRDPVKLVGDFFAAPSGADEGRGGRSIAAGDVNGDGVADLIVTGDNLLGTGNRVTVFSGADLIGGRFPGVGAIPIADFAAGGMSPSALVSVAAVDADADGQADVAVGSGAGQESQVRVYRGQDLAGAAAEPASSSFDPFGTVTGGVFVG